MVASPTVPTATPSNGVDIEGKQSGWSGINGKIGYGETLISGASVTERLGVTEIQIKAARQQRSK